MYLCILLLVFVSLGSLHGVRLDPISCCQADQAAQMVRHLTPHGITVSDRHPPHPECQMEGSQLSNFQVFDPTYYDAVSSFFLHTSHPFRILMVIVVMMMANPERNLCVECGRCCLYFKGWEHQLKVKSVDYKEEEAMTEVLAHTISMLRGRNGSNSSRNLEWDALDTLPPVCPPAECYIHADYIHRVLHTYRLHVPCSTHICRLHVPCSTHMQATCTSALCTCRLQATDILCCLHTVCWL